MNQRMRKWIKKIPLWIQLALAVLSSHLTAWAIEHHILEAKKLPILFTAGLTGLFVILFPVIAYCIHEGGFFQPRTRHLRKKVPDQKRHLVLFLSNLPEKGGTLRDGVPANISIRGALESDIQTIQAEKRKGTYWQWEMPLRGIWHHIRPRDGKPGRLKGLTIVCSEGSKGSIKQVDWFIKLLQQYRELKEIKIKILARKNHQIVLWPYNPTEAARMDGFDFEDFETLSDALIYLLRDLEKQDIHERDIIIDFTGGKKPTSMVAGAMTFNTDIEAQYIQTEEPWGVLGYDMYLGAAKRRGLE